MTNKILTVVIDTPDLDLSDAVTNLVADLQSQGVNVQQIRVADDSGETLVPVPEPAPPPPTRPPAEEEAEVVADDETVEESPKPATKGNK